MNDKTKEKQIRCANFLNLEARKETVKEYEKHNCDPNDKIHYNIIDNNICMECEFGIEDIARILQVVKSASGDLGARLAIDVRNMTGKPIQRVCFKEHKNG